MAIVYLTTDFPNGKSVAV